MIIRTFVTLYIYIGWGRDSREDGCEYYYNGKVKRSSLDRSCCHLHTSEKHFWLQPMAPWTLAAAYECAVAQSMDPWAATKKALH